MIAGIVQDDEYFERFVEPRLDGERVSYLGPVGPDRARRAARRRARAPAPDHLRRAVRLQRRRGDGVRNAGDRPSRAGRCPSSIRDGVNGFLVDSLDEAVAACGRPPAGPDARCAPRSSVRFDVEPHGRRVPRASISGSWRSTARGAARCRRRPVGERFRLGVNYWPARTAMGWWSSFDRGRGRRRLRADRRERSRLGAALPDAGRRSNRHRTRSIRRCSIASSPSADLRGRSRASRWCPPSSPVT